MMWRVAACSGDTEARLRWTVVGVLLAALCTYGASIGSGIFQYDDLHSIVGNLRLRSLTHVPSYFTDPGSFTTLTFGGMFRPLVLLSYALTDALFGENAAAYHFGNVAIHAASGVAVAVVLLRLGVGGVVSGLAALLFVCHPLNTEAAVYISSRAESMCTLFLLVSFYLWLGGSSQRSGWRTHAGLVAAPVAFAMALMCKSVAVVYPLLLLSCDIIRQRRHTEEEGGWRRGLWRHGPCWVVAGVYLFVVSGALGKALIAEPVRGPAVQLWTQSKALVYYARLIMLPRGLSVEHAFAESSTIWDATVLLALGVLISGVVVTVRSVGTSSSTGFWLAWMPLVLMPTLIVPLNVLVNEHRLYPVMVAATFLVLQVMKRPPWGLSATVVLVLLLGVLAHQRAQVWASPMTLWSDASAKAPRMPRPYLFVGDAHFQAARHEQALTSYAQAEKVNPQRLSPGDQLALHNNRGAVLLALGRNTEAESSYEAALRLVPDYPPAVEALEGLRAIRGQATRHPEAEAMRRSGLMHMVAGDLVAAEQALRASLLLQNDSRTRLALALVYERQQQPHKAAAIYRELLRSEASPATLEKAGRGMQNLRSGGVAE
ncbi:MAG: tetratricopeptide repeat protein [Candidatus Latescibacteria bacterium]|nr:tetratricopeptide repeat protein [Candidatus Latescibacterota bacterium]